ncbi:hypothetical protein SAMN05216386_2043 [Nitrosospira briensis]|uniref:Uncharacterized protein n=1 Tax=Nitrosospira briensis TaxID=35799 RepID=A0A1I5CKS1_9PROT|nr:hypothetical protein SAMN05216386_2043 [Nitrosospira briensis]
MAGNRYSEGPAGGREITIINVADASRASGSKSNSSERVLKPISPISEMWLSAPKEITTRIKMVKHQTLCYKKYHERSRRGRRLNGQDF